MRLLLFTNIIPYPLTEGGKTAQFVFLSQLVQEQEVHLVCESNTQNTEIELTLLQNALPKLKIHRLCSTESQNRETVLQKIITRINWEYTKRVEKKKKGNPVLDNPLFINPVAVRNQEIILQFTELLDLIKPDLVQVDFIDNADIAAVIPSGIKKIIVLHDMRSASIKQVASISGYKENYINYITKVVKHKELDFLRDFDGVLTFSKEDSEILKAERLPNVYVSPFAVPIKKMKEDIELHYPVKKMVFAGPEQHYPNKDAVKWYADDILPVLLPEVSLRLQVIGKWSKMGIEETGGGGSVYFSGFAENFDEELIGAVMLVPIRIGSGIRTKILDAFAKGVPVITTPTGVEGIPVEHRKHCMIAEDPEQFKSCITELLHSPELIFMLRKNALELVKQSYSPAAVYKKRISIYQTILER